jgi:hypothetical protein
MLPQNLKYITDNSGKKTAVILPIKDFKAIIEELEELEDIKLYDEAKKANEASYAAEDVFKRIEEKRLKK